MRETARGTFDLLAEMRQRVRHHGLQRLLLRGAARAEVPRGEASGQLQGQQRRAADVVCGEARKNGSRTAAEFRHRDLERDFYSRFPIEIKNQKLDPIWGPSCPLPWPSYRHSLVTSLTASRPQEPRFPEDAALSQLGSSAHTDWHAADSASDALAAGGGGDWACPPGLPLLLPLAGVAGNSVRASGAAACRGAP